MMLMINGIICTCKMHNDGGSLSSNRKTRYHELHNKFSSSDQQWCEQAVKGYLEF